MTSPRALAAWAAAANSAITTAASISFFTQINRVNHRVLLVPLARIRTCNLTLTRGLLYHWSYSGHGCQSSRVVCRNTPGFTFLGLIKRRALQRNLTFPILALFAASVGSVHVRSASLSSPSRRMRWTVSPGNGMP